MKFLWLLDNGHGKQTPGKRSPRLPDGKVFFEWHFNRVIVNGIAERLRELGISHTILVPEIEVGDILEDRVRRANAYAKVRNCILVSVHSNAGPGEGWSKATGIETWHYSKSERSAEIAKVFQKQLVKFTGLPSRGVKFKSIGEFYVLRRSSMPAVLTENGFFNNLNECQFLLSPEGQKKIIDAHVEAILEIERLAK